MLHGVKPKAAPLIEFQHTFRVLQLAITNCATTYAVCPPV